MQNVLVMLGGISIAAILSLPIVIFLAAVLVDAGPETMWMQSGFIIPPLLFLFFGYKGYKNSLLDSPSAGFIFLAKLSVVLIFLILLYVIISTFTDYLEAMSRGKPYYFQSFWFF